MPIRVLDVGAKKWRINRNDCDFLSSAFDGTLDFEERI